MSRHLVTCLCHEFLLFVSCSILTQNITASSNFSFSDINGTLKFNHLVLDENKDMVFIGAVNHLYQLSPELHLIAKYETNSNSDSLKCPSNNQPLAPDNFNKLLVIDYAKSRLIACGSNFQGICSLHDTKNISNRIAISCESVVANNAKASTFAFVSHADSKSTLHVGVTYPGNSTHPSKLPAISSRSLDNETLFKVIKGNMNGASISLNPEYVDAYPINYIYGFSLGPYSYFLTTQKNSTKKPFSFISKIIRFCNKNGNSYIEIPIECVDENQPKNVYNLVQVAFIEKPTDESFGSSGNTVKNPLLYVIFSQSKQAVGEESKEPMKHSALCVYSLPEIDYKFIENSVNCRNGNGYQTSTYIPPNQRCTKGTIVSIDADICWLNVKLLLGGIEPVRSFPVIKFDTILTAISMASTGKFIVVFVGTHTGFLKKIVMKYATALQYEEIPIDKGSALISLQLDKKKEHIYVMSEKKLIRIPVQNCQAYPSDLDCVEIGDPYCGWCLPKNRCTLFDECAEAQDDPLLWIPYNIRTQIVISKVVPETTTLNDITNLTLTVENLPQYENLFCEFTIFNEVLITNVTRMKNNLNCLVPYPKLAQEMKGYDASTTAKLSIGTRNIPDLLGKKFKFYNCYAYNNCALCAASAQCYWLVKEEICLYKQAYNCLNYNTEMGEICHQRDCPSTKLIFDESTKKFIPDGTQQCIKAEAHNFHYFPASTQYFCTFKIEGEIFIRNATLENTTINCDETEFRYFQNQPEARVEFHVTRDNSEHRIDELEEMVLFVYKCKFKAEKRDICSALNGTIYQCIWCLRLNTCESEIQSIVYSENWFERCEMSPKSFYLYFDPKVGPFEGGTIVRIRNHGQNHSVKDLEVNITVAGIPCIPLNDSGVHGLIKCSMSGISSMPYNVISGPVVVRIGNHYSQSEDNFTIVDPIISDISPKQGPQIGGTELTIKGKHMNAGSDIKVFIDELPCMLFEKHPTTLKCIITPAMKSVKGFVNVIFDGNRRVFQKDFYEYMDNHNLSSEAENRFIPKGTPQGGGQILMHGFNLKQVSEAFINVTYSWDNKNQPRFYFGKCEVLNDSLMACSSPSIPMTNCCIDLKFPKLLQYGIVITPVNINSFIETKYRGKFILYCDPKSCMDREIFLLESSPLLAVIVTVVITAVFALILFFTFKKSSKTTHRKKIQARINKLELCVAAECKEAFAELQTEMSDSKVMGIPENLPFWDYRTYVMKTLFPNTNVHSKILCDNPELTKKRRELQLFNQLITNKTFLVIFIQTLENDESFTMNDRVYFGSMIMIVLQNEMEYCTDVIKTLLASLIVKSTKRPSQPKLLLRRSESVVEKMLSAWFTFLLYRFLQECAGKPLFTLFKSIKQQVDKGPIDEITSEARYSLNESKIIRQQIAYASITVYVSVSQQTAINTGLTSAVENVPITMLDCDTISQAKEKAVSGIYFAVNYSKRPKLSEVDLELWSGSSGGMILYNSDLSSEIEGEWKKRNTLHHYGINDGSTLTLILAKKDGDLIPVESSSSDNEEEEISPCEGLKSTLIECATPKTFRARYKSVPDIDAYYKEWHLVKPTQLNDDSAYHNDSNMVSEVYLTRLLSTKGTLQKFVDDLFETIFSETHQNNCFPIAIKYMFDFLDDQACKNGITNPQITHTWKNNCLPLRFWVNLIKNPDFLFDIHKSNIIDSCLNVVAQAFMDSCSIAEDRLCKNSPTAKLLYAKDIPFYKEWVKKYYSDVKAMPAVSRDNMSAMLGKESQLHSMDFNTNAAVYELFKYAVKYREKLMIALREDQFSQKYNLANKLEEVFEVNTTTLKSDFV